jgi:hypothetical protein
MANPVPKGARVSPLFTVELVEAQGRVDREYLTARVKILLEAKDKYPTASFADIAQIANDACGRGCCCCCNTLVLGADVVNPIG